MTHTRIGMTVGALICAGVMVAGCAGEGEPEPTAPSTATETETPNTEAPDPTEDAGEEGDLEAEATTEGEREPLDERVNERGNVPMPENNPAGLMNVETMEPAVEWEASAVNTDVSCSNWVGESSEGEMFTVDFDIAVFEGAEVLPTGDFMVSGSMFYIADEDGQVVTDRPSTGSAINCLDSADELPRTALRPGQSATGSLVFESPIRQGYLVYHEYLADTYYEWEFDLN